MQLGSGDMKNDAQIVVRLPQEMADRLKAYAERLEQEFGVPVSLAVATRKLLESALDAAGHGPADTAKAKPKSRR